MSSSSLITTHNCPTALFLPSCCFGNNSLQPHSTGLHAVTIYTNKTTFWKWTWIEKVAFQLDEINTTVEELEDSRSCWQIQINCRNGMTVQKLQWLPTLPSSEVLCSHHSDGSAAHYSCPCDGTLTWLRGGSGGGRQETSRCKALKYKLFHLSSAYSVSPCRGWLH